jgi:hypothetical protein
MPQNQTERGEAARAMHRLLAGGWVAQIIHAAAELGLTDHFGEEAKDVASLPSATARTRPRFRVCCVSSPPSAPRKSASVPPPPALPRVAMQWAATRASRCRWAWTHTL